MDPSGRFRIPNVKVFVPSGTLPSISPGAGASCPTAPSGATTTGPDGTTSVQVASGGSLVVAQIGKWRAETNVPGCSSAGVTIKLPKSNTDGSVPAIAVTTGKGDTLECAIHRLDMDGVVTFFQGGGGVAPSGAASSSTLLGTESGMLPFDAVILSCEAAATANASSTALASYIASGGMVYAEHWGYSVLDAAPFTSDNVATWNTGSDMLTGTTNAVVQTSAPAGTYFRTWLGAQGVLGTANELPMTNDESASNVASLGSASTLWLAADSSASVPNSPLLFSWTSGSGRLVYADYHVATAVGDYATTAGSVSVTSGTYPSGCASEATLQPAELAFLYTLFEQLSCGM